MGATDRSIGDDQTQAGKEATGEVGSATGMDRRGARLMAKRANGEGTKIVKVPDRDLYKARYTDARGKRRTVYGKMKGVVRQKLTEGLADRDKVRPTTAIQ
jgi:hypothetical protein